MKVVMAIMFADVAGYSKLKESQVETPPPTPTPSTLTANPAPTIPKPIAANAIIILVSRATGVLLQQLLYEKGRVVATCGVHSGS